MKASSVCVDANLVVKALTPDTLAARAAYLIDGFQGGGVTLVAPSLLAFEVTSALRRAVFLKYLSAEHGEQAFNLFLAMKFRYVSRSEVVQLAWRLAKSLNLSRAYDSAYLAVSQLNQCEFWTADKRLYNAVHDTLDWVRWIEETPPTMS